MMSMFWNVWDSIVARLKGANDYVPGLVLRLIMFWEYWESGLEKYNGENWFENILEKFPFPFDVVPVGLSWFMATWFEIVGAIAILLGLFTRFFAFTLLVLTFVATAAVHWPAEWGSLSELWEGYRVSGRGGSGNFKLPLLFSVILIPLVFNGGGKLSLDHLLNKFFRDGSEGDAIFDRAAIGITLLAFGIPFAMLIPTFGVILIVAGGAMLAWQKFAS